VLKEGVTEQQQQPIRSATFLVIATSAQTLARRSYLEIIDIRRLLITRLFLLPFPLAGSCRAAAGPHRHAARLLFKFPPKKAIKVTAK